MRSSGRGPFGFAAKSPDHGEGVGEDASGAAVVVVDAAAGAVAAADDEHPGAKAPLELGGKPTDKAAVVHAVGEVEGEQPEPPAAGALARGGEQTGPGRMAGRGRPGRRPGARRRLAA